MTIIVMSPKEGKLITDRYVVDISKDERITDCKFKIAKKSETTKDNYFHYCFDRVVRDEVSDLIFNYLIRYENGSLGLDEKLKFDKRATEDIKCYIMSKRACYAIIKNAKSSEVEISVRNYLTHNFKYGLGPVLSRLDFKGLDLFEMLTQSNVCCTYDYDVLYQKSLTLIPKVKSKKGSN